jgi:NhaP-type Na+/H+ or K+/H+ antiporter
MAGGEEVASHASELLGIQLLGVLIALGLGTAMHRNHVLWLPESLVTTLTGAAVGVVCRYALPADKSASMGFWSDLFVYALLPGIIFQAGFALPLKAYRRNVGAILTFSIPGTLISTAVIAGVLYGAGYAGRSLPLSPAESLAFASLLSATDPVATLAVYGALGVHSDLNALVAGESLGNDAVAVVLFRAFTGFVASGAAINEGGIVRVVVTFVVVLCGSTAIGLGAGVLATALFRATYAPPAWLRLPDCCRCGAPRPRPRAARPTARALSARLAQLSATVGDGSRAPSLRAAAGPHSVVEEWRSSSSSGSAAHPPAAAAAGVALPPPPVPAPAAVVVGNPFRDATTASPAGAGDRRTRVAQQLQVQVTTAPPTLEVAVDGALPSTHHHPLPQTSPLPSTGASEAHPLTANSFALGSPPAGGSTAPPPNDGDDADLTAAADAALESALLGRHHDDDVASAMAQGGVLMLIGYGAYIAAETAQLSGIVAALFAGVTCQRYATLLMSRSGLPVAHALLRTVAGLADTLVFFSIGLDVALWAQPGTTAPDFVAWAVAACLVSRAVNVFPLAAAVNTGVCCRRAVAREAPSADGRRPPAVPLAIPVPFQLAMWHAGLRGAIAYASAITFPGPNAEAVQSCTAAVVLVTLALSGTTVVPVLSGLRIPYDKGDGPPPEPPERVFRGGWLPLAELRLQHALAGGPAFRQWHDGDADPQAVLRRARKQAAVAAAAAAAS